MPRFRLVARADAIDVPGHLQSLDVHQILDDIIPCFVHVGIDSMSRQIPGPPSEPDADVAADLPNPYPLPLELQRRGP